MQLKCETYVRVVDIKQQDKYMTEAIFDCQGIDAGRFL